MIFSKTILVISLLLLSVTHVQAANVDFNTIYNGALETCNDKQISKDCKSMNESNPDCDSSKSKDGFVGNDTSTSKPCVNVKAGSHYVEPKFSTKRPRGQ